MASRVFPVLRMSAVLRSTTALPAVGRAPISNMMYFSTKRDGPDHTESGKRNDTRDHKAPHAEDDKSSSSTSSSTNSSPIFTPFFSDLQKNAFHLQDQVNHLVRNVMDRQTVSPFDTRFRTPLSQLFPTPFTPSFGSIPTPWPLRSHGPQFPMDMVDEEGALTVRADLPGLKKGDVEVTVDKDKWLVISGERKADSTRGDESSGASVCERSFGSFRRGVLLPDNLDTDNIAAEFKDGVLTIKIPKIKSDVKEEKAKKVEIK